MKFCNLLVLAVFAQATPQATPLSEDIAEITGGIGVLAKDTFKCTKFPSNKPVKSICTKHLGEGCTLETYSDLVRTMNRHDMSTEACVSGDRSYGSYTVVCN